MITLLQSVTGGEDWGKIYDLLVLVGDVYGLVFLLMSFFNITTSLFVDQALKLSRPDHEVRMLEKWKEDMNAANDLRNMLNCVDEDDSGVVTREEWLKMAE